MTSISFLACVCLLRCISAQTVVNYSVSENDPPSVLGNIVNEANLQLPAQGVFFTVLPISSRSDRFFQVENNGNFKTIAAINRDLICAQLTTCTINLDVQVNPAEYFEIVKVTVLVNDLNDESPRFDQSVYTLYLSEASPVGSPVILPTAVDRDSPTNGIVAYSTSNLDSSVFRFSWLSQLNLEPRLGTLKLLDRESVPSYEFTLYARDNASPANSGSTIVRIELADVNDSPPVFSADLYEVTIEENKPVNDSILQVNASDRDTGVRARVFYYLNDASLASYPGLFRIEETTGILRVNGTLDYEQFKEAHLVVIGRNQEPTSPSSQTKVLVHLKDINDEAPVISVKTRMEAGALSLVENATLPSFVAHIHVEDLDSGKGGEVTCNLTNHIHSSFALMQLHSTDFKLITNKLFDRENKAKYEITINCTDRGIPPLSSYKNISIIITDINDNSPVFENSTYEVVVSENDTPERAVIRVRAHDRDIDNNGRIRYEVVSINPDSEVALNHLKLDQVKGELTVIKPFDYEVTKSVLFNISATDYGNPERSSQCTVIIKILDTDDQLPTFQKPDYEMTLFENNAVGEFVGQVWAVDGDSAMYSQVTYWFLSFDHNDTGNSSLLLTTDGIFIINNVNGDIHVNASLDREKLSNYTLTIIAVGPGPRYHNDTCNVEVIVQDQNDNSPYISFPNAVNYSVSVPISLKNKDIIAKVVATDSDTGENAVLTYDIVSGNDNDLFMIDRNTGVIMVTRDYTPDLPDYQVNLLILVTDTGSQKLSQSSRLQIIFNLLDSQELVVVSGKNADAVIAIGVLSGIIVVVLLTAIVCVFRGRRGRKHETLKTVSENVTFDPVNLHTTQDIGALKTPDMTEPGSPSIQGLGLCELDGSEFQKAGMKEDGAAGGQSKDSSSQGSNTDSGRGSHEETGSLSAMGKLQRWLNVPLATSSSSLNDMQEGKESFIDEKQSDPECKRLQLSQSFRNDSSAPELPPRTIRSQSFNTITESQEPPPLPPPRKVKHQNRLHSFLSSREFDDQDLYNFSRMMDTYPHDSNNMPRVLHHMPIDSVDRRYPEQGLVDCLDYSPVVYGVQCDVYSNLKHNNAYGNIPIDQTSDNSLLIDFDNVFLPDSMNVNRSTKYCSQV